ncbi:hypothetical protein CMO89_01510 [Candidatus Woesearchaeota archaeon]|nr:hypothetical protein [Candidatus Woesearchaeota archaeon]
MNIPLDPVKSLEERVKSSQKELESLMEVKALGFVNKTENIDVGIDLSRVYAELSGSYSQLALLYLEDGKEEQTVMSYLDAAEFLEKSFREMKQVIGDFDFNSYKDYESKKQRFVSGFYNWSKESINKAFKPKVSDRTIEELSEQLDNTALKLTSNIQEHFTKFELEFRNTVNLWNNLKSQVYLSPKYSELLKQQKMQAYAFANAIRKAAKAVKNGTEYGDDWGWGFTPEKPVPYAIRVTKMTKLETLQREKQKEIDGYNKKTPDQRYEWEEKKHKNRLAKLRRQIRNEEANPDYRLYDIPKKDRIVVQIERESEHDKEYAFLTEPLFKYRNILGIQTKTAGQHSQLQESTLVPAPTLLINHRLFDDVRQEFYNFGVYQNPALLDQLCDVACQRGGISKVAEILTDYQPGRLESISTKVKWNAKKISYPIGRLFKAARRISDKLTAYMKNP